MIRLQIQKDDGTPMPAANSCVTITVNLLHYLLLKVIIMKFNKTVSDSSNMYAYRAYLETLINCSNDI